jgi:hypothetical protein
MAVNVVTEMLEVEKLCGMISLHLWDELVLRVGASRRVCV